MSRAQQNSTGRLRLAPAALGLGLAAVLGAVGCSAGQITQTDSQPPSVNGSLAQVGQIAVRDAKLAYPHGGSYPQGSDAPVILTLVNVGSEADTLVELSSPAAASVEVTGDTALPGGAVLVVGTPGEEAKLADSAHAQSTSPAHPESSHAEPAGSSHAATSPTPPPATSSAAATTTATTTGTQLGKLKVVLKGLNAKLVPGQTIPITLVFAKAGPVTFDLPIAAPNGPREEQPKTEH
ncbi:copper chaperone PCu(A)C [Actinokineospora iranica]|uniref:Copper(I)-binding protein n=1 Tax=Actinokineospora iranica TaxID=1271860 RepID=A0A1G6Z110_9PSEU|nr:copper chaperone PCu(A)C [Actinokineospora iranica]SDD95506.1 Copper(I)-binding protein [Actinokineospora iranica]